jgi:hypothetical protein
MWPKLSNIDESVKNKILSYSRPDKASELNSWIRVFSGALKGQLQGLILQSNTDSRLLRAAGETIDTLYGDSQNSGVMGKDWTGKVVESNSTRFLRPSPIVTGFSVKEGQDQISRQATLQLTAYTLEQMEDIQTYFLEAGYSLFIEWGWNTIDGVRGITKTNNTSTDDILNNISEKSLNFENILSTRKKSLGEYDSFLGFIVGGNVTSEGDTFNISVELRGQPSLPTYLQSYRNSKSINSEKITTDKVNSLFGISEITDENEGTVAQRRFKYFFNELPADKQLKSIYNLYKDSSINKHQFINFDKGIEKKIVDTSNRGGFYGGDPELNKEGIKIQKEDLFSKNKYVRMDLVVKVLNTLGKLDKFEIGNKQVSFQIDIEDCIIGGFPNMFSINANKLIIPGKIPDFAQYFLEGDTVEQRQDGYLIKSGEVYEPINPDDSLVPFLSEKPLDKNYKEDAKYYGYLKYLFVNFEVLKSVLNRKIINSREAFISILNELSSAVNAFWKFQIVEGEFRETQNEELNLGLQALSLSGYTGQSFYSYDLYDVKKSTKKNGDIVLKVIDENFIGQLPTNIKENISEFQHNGSDSVFLNANLDISLPASMVGQIVSSRGGALVNPDAPIFLTTKKTFFESQGDLFIKITQNTESSGSSPGTEIETKAIDDFKTFGVGQGQLSVYLDGQTGDNQRLGVVDPSNGYKITEVERNEPLLRLFQQLAREEEAKKEEEAKRRGSNLQAYLKRLDAVPKPSIDVLTLKDSFNKSESKISDTSLNNVDWVKQKFAFFCFDDSDFFDLLKNQSIRNKSDENSPKNLSTLIPIKYTFTILGNSGIQRGDVFRIKGIPKKYSERGIFQVTEIEHTLEQGKWTTQVGGLFRQIQ